jgi:hypothetical protein
MATGEAMLRGGSKKDHESKNKPIMQGTNVA